MSIPINPNDYFKTTNGLDPLLLSEMPNTITANDIINRYKGQNHDLIQIGELQKTDYFNNLMKCTSAKKAYCALLKNKNAEKINIRIPMPNGVSNIDQKIKAYDLNKNGEKASNIEYALNFYNKYIPIKKDQFNDNLGITPEYCNNFMTVYCQNVYEDLGRKMGGKKNITQSDMTLYCPECACYGNTYFDMSKFTYNDNEEDVKVGTAIKILEPLYKQKRSCQLEGCTINHYSPEEYNSNCGAINVQYCNNTTAISGNIDSGIETVIKGTNNCIQNAEIAQQKADKTAQIAKKDEQEATKAEQKANEPTATKEDKQNAQELRQKADESQKIADESQKIADESQKALDTPINNNTSINTPINNEEEKSNKTMIIIIAIIAAVVILIVIIIIVVVLSKKKQTGGKTKKLF